MVEQYCGMWSLRVMFFIVESLESEVLDAIDSV